MKKVVVEVIEISIVIPLHNEEANIAPLHQQIHQALKECDFSYEIIYVDDGSTDKTFVHLSCLPPSDHTHIIQLRRNYGQTAAIAAGIAHSSGNILICMDGDLQNDPHDIPCLLLKLEEGYDLVSGWRKKRKDAFLHRRLPSWLANKLISRVTGVALHDYGCTLKAYRREVFEHFRLYGDMHRLLPAYADLGGAMIAEIEVAHHPRYSGCSKYGLTRITKVVLDLIMFKFTQKYATKPLHAFATPGLVSILLSGILLPLLVVRRIIFPQTRSGFPYMMFMLFCLIAGGIGALMLGVLAELVMHVYHEAQDKPIYAVRRTLSLQQRAKAINEDSHSI
jgi:glycosyltransferase involved in cell wall biosynthesis